MAIAVFALALVVSLSACYKAPPRESQDLDYQSAESMVRAADRIDHVRLTNVAVEQVEQFDQTTGASLGDFPVTYLVFDTVESFKGSASKGDTINVAVNTPGLWSFRPDGQTIKWNVGDEYLVFIKGRVRTSNYPSDYGEALWTPNGEPWVARINTDDTLDFAVSNRYLGVVGKDHVPFTLDMAGLRFLTGS